MARIPAHVSTGQKVTRLLPTELPGRPADCSTDVSYIIIATK